MSAISWELKLATFIPLQFRRKGWLAELSGDREWCGRASCNRVCMYVCGAGKEFKGPAQCTECNFFFVALLLSWSLWLSDSGAQWHFLIGFPSLSPVASTVAQQSLLCILHVHSMHINWHYTLLTSLFYAPVYLISCCCSFLNSSVLLQPSHNCARGNTQRTGWQLALCALRLASDPLLASKAFFRFGSTVVSD